VALDEIKKRNWGVKCGGGGEEKKGPKALVNLPGRAGCWGGTISRLTSPGKYAKKWEKKKKRERLSRFNKNVKPGSETTSATDGGGPSWRQGIGKTKKYVVYRDGELTGAGGKRKNSTHQKKRRPTERGGGGRPQSYKLGGY